MYIYIPAPPQRSEREVGSGRHHAEQQQHEERERGVGELAPRAPRGGQQPAGGKWRELESRFQVRFPRIDFDWQ